MTVADQFESSHHGSYLLSHSVGLPLKSAGDRLVADYFDVWTSDPTAAWPAWLGVIDGFRESLGRLLGGEAGSFCPQSNVSSGFTKILQAVRPSGRVPIVLLAEEAFPSLGYVCQHAGYEVRYLPEGVDAVDPAAWSEELRRGVDVALITQVHSNTGQLSPVPEIVEAARVHGVMSVIDVAQSAGVIPIDLGNLSADFVVGSCVKWLCGGPGAGWLWVNPDVIARCAPTDVGWFSHADPFEFDIHDFRYADDALRFWGGTPSVLPYAVARRSIDVFVDLGVVDVRRRNVELVDRLIEGCGELVVSPLDPERRSGTVVVDAGERSAQVLAALDAAGVAVDSRSTGVRLSPHVYNSVDDIDRAVAAIVGCVA